jgi:hypothetical protein
LFVFSQSTLAQDIRSAAPAVFSCADVTEIPRVECEALVALYNSTNGAGWTNKSGWLANNTPCQWQGVGCSGTHVYQVFLPSNNLQGNLPQEFWNLTGLTNLNLYDNKLSGNISSAIGNLRDIRRLLLDHNSLIGVIPPEIGLLVNLVSLELDSNQLTGAIPPEIGNLTRLRGLQLGFNRLSGGVPPEFGNMTNLLGLSLDFSPLLRGPLPQSLTNLDLGFFEFNHTYLCEPDNAAFQAWVSAIPYARRTALCADANGFIDQYMGGTLVYTGTAGSRITISAPAQAVTETTYLAYTAVSSPPSQPPNLVFAGVAFGLEAYQNGVHQPGFAFQGPVTIAIAYTDEQIEGLDESSLTLDYNTESGWVDAATTCNPVSVYDRHPAENLLSLNVCHLSSFALFASEEPALDHRVYLPLTQKP